MAIPVGMIVIGSIHLNHCPAENLIPVFLLVGGSVWTIQCTVALVQTCCCPNSKETKGEEEKKKLHPFEALVNTFMACWFMAGTVWVYRTYGNFDSDPKSGNYCDHTLYSFAFWWSWPPTSCLEACAAAAAGASLSVADHGHLHHVWKLVLLLLLVHHSRWLITAIYIMFGSLCCCCCWCITLGG
ncbi:transmembrane protein 272-like isoform X1 [Haliotis rubra]|uniref:transmembrane protein 272-like isoform X1 n=1 Tax=Haliotis rubra TaxID=36100 RepID=UPI001EE5AC66|nr:transmembrane protein 272-like isoform X1 [Haliotis rubra]